VGFIDKMGLPNLVRVIVLSSALLMIVGRTPGLQLMGFLGLGVIIGAPWLLLLYYASLLGRRLFAASVVVALFFSAYVVFLSQGFVP